MIGNELFYNELPKYKNGLTDLLTKEEYFRSVPDNWHIVLVDVKDSTFAVQNGRHDQVNLSATGSIVSVLNYLKEKNSKLKIPYFFGGDGVTFIIPQIFLEGVLSILENYRHHVSEHMHLVLRVGSMPVEEMYAEHRQIKLAKLALNGQMMIPILLGTGLKEAEQRIKSSFVNDSIKSEDINPVNLEGMECRWQEIKPELKEEKVVCLLVFCPDDFLQRKVYLDIFTKIDLIFGKYRSRQPISVKELKLDLSIQKIKQEMYARLGKYSLTYLLKNWLITIIGKYYFKWFNEGQKYLRMVRQKSYTLMVDGMINNVISGTQPQIDELISFLDNKETQGEIIYGIHVTHASIMSCYVEDRKTNKHIHFIDGTEGGYTSASLMYKAKLADMIH